MQAEILKDKISNKVLETDSFSTAHDIYRLYKDV